MGKILRFICRAVAKYYLTISFLIFTIPGIIALFFLIFFDVNLSFLRNRPELLFELDANEYNFRMTNDLIDGGELHPVLKEHGVMEIRQSSDSDFVYFKYRGGHPIGARGKRIIKFKSGFDSTELVTEKADSEKIYIYIYNERFHNFVRALFI